MFFSSSFVCDYRERSSTPRTVVLIFASLLALPWFSTASFAQSQFSAQQPRVQQPVATWQPLNPLVTQQLTTAPATFDDDAEFDDDYSIGHKPYQEPWRPSLSMPDRYRVSQLQDAQRQADDYRRLAATMTQPLNELALENVQLIDQWLDLANSQQLLLNRLNQAQRSLENARHDLEDVKSKLELYGMTTTVGMLLQNKREQLRQWQLDLSADRFAANELSRTRQQQLQLEMLRFDGSDPVTQSVQFLFERGLISDNVAALPPRGTNPSSVNLNSSTYNSASLSVAGLNNQNLLAEVQSQLRGRNQWVLSLKQGYADYQQRLSELDSVVNEQAQLYTSYRSLIDRKIIWIRNGAGFAFSQIAQFDEGYEALFSTPRSADLGYALKHKWTANPIRGASMLCWVSVILLVRLLARRALIAIGGRKWMREASKDSRKAVAGVLCLLAAFAIPSVLYLMANWMSGDLAFEATQQVANALYAAAIVALFVEVPRQLLNNCGLVDKHIAVELPRRPRALAYMTLVGAGLVMSAYLVSMLSEIDHGIYRDSSARITLILALLLVAWTFHLALRPAGGALEPLVATLGGTLLHRVRVAVYLAAIALPLGLILLLGLGYAFTVNQLIQRAIVTFVGALVIGTLWTSISVFMSLLWLQLTGIETTRRHDAYGPIHDRKPAAKQVAGVLAEHNLELKHQLKFLSQCGLTIGIVGALGWVWIDVFPNLRLGNPVVWTVQREVAQAATNFAGPPTLAAQVVAEPITVLHLIAAAVTLFVSFQLAKLLPGLLDALVLQRVSYDEAMEHFLLVLGRCVLFGSGCLIASQWIGLQWQTVQWLVVGLAIGVGYGLQDVVRSLLGGLIVLFEKPARLGDLITVGKVTGRVASQKFRTTTVADADGREIIIPNKNFVNEEVVHWMGSGRLKSIRLEVAVNRDQRPSDLCRALQQLVTEQPETLLTPAPQATLVCIGKVSQRIEIQAWIEDHLNAERYRDNLLREVLEFLRGKEWLVPGQPTQPRLGDDEASLEYQSLNRRVKRTARRSA